MSKDELVNAYLQGRVSRRMFVRGVVATGVSVTAAVAFADVLAGAVTAPPRRVGSQQYGGAPAPGAAEPAATAVTARPRVTG